MRSVFGFGAAVAVLAMLVPASADAASKKKKKKPQVAGFVQVSSNGFGTIKNTDKSGTTKRFGAVFELAGKDRTQQFFYKQQLERGAGG